MNKKERSLVSKSSNSLNGMIKGSSVTINNSHLKKITFIATAILMLSVVATFSFGDMNSVLAAKGAPGKSVEVQDISQGYPSGPHFNLNIHGRDIPWNGCEEVTFPDALGKNINVPIRTEGLDHIPQIEFITNNKKTDVTTLSVLDNCTQHVHPSDHDPARILLPANPAEGEYPGGYYVYSRILAKPTHGNDTPEPSNALFYPNLDLLTLCNDTLVDSIAFQDLTDCEDVVLALGQVTPKGEVFDAGGDPLLRFDPEQVNPKGKQTGKSKAVDITGMFYWTGAVCDEKLDTDGDGTLELEDFDVIPDVAPLLVINHPGDGDGVVKAEDLDQLILLGIIDSDGKTGAELMAIADTGGVGGEIDEEEFLALLDLLLDCDAFLDPVWIFDIADIVIHGFDYVNDGAKLVQIRFYDANAVNVQYVGEIPFLQP